MNSAIEQHRESVQRSLRRGQVREEAAAFAAVFALIGLLCVVAGA